MTTTMRRPRVPTVRGNLTVRTDQSTPVGECGHCGETVWLRYNGDCLETSISHAGEQCEAWQLGGKFYFARATAVHAETSVDIARAHTRAETIERLVEGDDLCAEIERLEATHAELVKLSRAAHEAYHRDGLDAFLAQLEKVATTSQAADKFFDSLLTLARETVAAKVAARGN